MSEETKQAVPKVAQISITLNISYEGGASEQMIFMVPKGEEFKVSLGTDDNPALMKVCLEGKAIQVHHYQASAPDYLGEYTGVVAGAEPPRLGCCHGRYEGQPCPHCMGINHG